MCVYTCVTEMCMVCMRECVLCVCVCCVLCGCVCVCIHVSGHRCVCYTTLRLNHFFAIYHASKASCPMTFQGSSSPHIPSCHRSPGTIDVQHYAQLFHEF